MADKSAVNVDLSAKASLELKAEVPKESTGRTIDALVDIIRPFTERRGLKADMIRLQRAEVAYEIAKIARKTAEVEQLQLVPPPNKFMVPFLEKASVEGDEDQELHERWAALLVSASTHFEAQHLTFLDILTRLSADELMLLEETCLAYKDFPTTYYPDGHSRENKTKVELLANTFNAGDMPDRGVMAIFYKRLADNPLVYGHVLYVPSRRPDGQIILYTDYGIVEGLRRSLQILERERLVSIKTVEGSASPIAYFEATYLGVAFVRNCSPAGRERAHKHIEQEKKKVARAVRNGGS